MSAQQSNQQQRPPERWKPESTEWYYPVPPKVKPGVGSGAPSDAIILFDGKDLSMWESAGKDGGPAKWTVKDGAMIVASGTGSIRTKDYFVDFYYYLDNISMSMRSFHWKFGVIMPSCSHCVHNWLFMNYLYSDGKNCSSHLCSHALTVFWSRISYNLFVISNISFFISCSDLI